MSDKRNQYRNNNVFEDDADTGKLETAEDIQTEYYGTRRKSSITKPTGRPVLVPITDLEPDPAQPRRIVPGVILDKEPVNRAHALNIWHHLAADALGQEIPVKDILRGKASDGWADTDHTQSPTIARDYIELCNFAASCRDGLINPITYYTANNRSIIETGERRWTAHVLLHSVLGHKKYEDIRAVNMGEFDLDRQIRENAARAGLDAIGHARAYARKMMGVHEAQGAVFKTIEECSPDNAYYEYFAQAADLRTPHGMGSEIGEVLGMSRSSMSQYSKLLKLPAEEWAKASEEHTSLNKLLAIIDAMEGTNYHRTNADNAPEIVHHDEQFDPSPNPTADLTQAIDDAAFSDSDNEQPAPQKNAANDFFVNQHVIMIGRGRATVNKITGSNIIITLHSTGSQLMVTPAHLKPMTNADSMQAQDDDHPAFARDDSGRDLRPLDASDSVDPQEFASGRSGETRDVFAALNMGDIASTPGKRLVQITSESSDPNFVNVKYLDDKSEDRFAVDYLTPVLTAQVIESTLEAHLLLSIGQYLANAIENKRDAQDLLRALDVLVASSPSSLSYQDDIDILLTRADALLVDAFHHLRLGYQKQAHKITSAWREAREARNEEVSE